MAVMKLIGTWHGVSPFDGQYLVEYDPSRPGTAPDGEPMLAHLVTTPDPAKALNLPAAELMELWKRSHGQREDGKPNRPLTAFTVEII